MGILIKNIDGRDGGVCLYGRHCLKIPIFGVIYVSNFSKWSGANGDALFMKKILKIEEWSVFTWFHLYYFQTKWLTNKDINIIAKLLEKISKFDLGRLHIRFHANGEIYIQIEDYEDRIEICNKLLSSGSFNVSKNYKRVRENKKVPVP